MITRKWLCILHLLVFYCFSVHKNVNQYSDINKKMVMYTPFSVLLFLCSQECKSNNCYTDNDTNKHETIPLVKRRSML